MEAAGRDSRRPSLEDVPAASIRHPVDVQWWRRSWVPAAIGAGTSFLGLGNQLVGGLGSSGRMISHAI